MSRVKRTPGFDRIVECNGDGEFPVNGRYLKRYFPFRSYGNDMFLGLGQ